MTTLDILDRLIAFPTVSKDSNLELIDWVQGLLDQGGFDVTRIPAPCGQKAGLFASTGPKVDGGLCLSAHTDVVPVDGQTWTRPPFRLTREGDRVYGRGTTDMKGFLASALTAALAASRTGLHKPLTLSISYDEEVGCVGLRQMMPTLQPLLREPELVIVGEPTNMQVATGHKGKCALSVTCKGSGGHSALAPNFTNAIYVAAAFVEEIQKLQTLLTKGPRDEGYSVPFSTLHVGKIHGGTALNIVPDDVKLVMEIRHLAATDPVQLLSDIEAAARRVEARFGREAKVEIQKENAYPGLQVDLPTSYKSIRNLAVPGRETKVSFGTEGGYFAQLGLTALVVGPGSMDQDGHQPDEGLDIQQLTDCDVFLGNLIRETLVG